MIKNSISKQQFADLYVLDAISMFLSGDDQKYRSELILIIANEYLEELKDAIRREASHITDTAIYPGHDEEKIEQLEKLNITSSSDFTEDAISNLSLKEYKILFDNIEWHQNYGGEAWSNIVYLTMQLENEIKKNDANKIMHTLDLIHQLEHNTASVFESFRKSSYDWIHDLLTEKALTNSLPILYKNLSERVKKLLKNSPLSYLIDEQYNEYDVAQEFVETEFSRAKKRVIQSKEKASKMYDKYKKMHQAGLIDNEKYKYLLADLDGDIAYLDRMENNLEFAINSAKRGGHGTPEFFKYMFLYYIKNDMTNKLSTIKYNPNNIRAIGMDKILEYFDLIKNYLYIGIIYDGVKKEYFHNGDIGVIKFVNEFFPIIKKLYDSDDGKNFRDHLIYNNDKIIMSIIENAIKLHKRAMINEDDRYGQMIDVITNAERGIESEFNRTDNDWLSCVGSKIFVIETYLDSSKIEKQLSNDRLRELRSRFENTKRYFFKLRKEYGNTLPPKEIRKNMIDLLNIIG